MKKITTTSYLNKNFEINDLIGGLEYLDPDDSLLDKILKSLTEFKDEVFDSVGIDAYFSFGDDRYEKEEQVLRKIHKKIKGTNFEKKIHKSIFDGSLLPTLSKNFKLVIYFEMKIYSHYLIHDRKEKKYYYVTNKRKWDKKNNEPIHKLIESYVAASFEKKPSKSEFFRTILVENEDREDEFMEKNKSIEYEKREKLWEKTAYLSSKGIDYIDLYKETYDKYLKDQSS